MIVLDHLTEAQRRAYRLADNKLTELGAWDEALLAGELQELLADDFDLSLVGFSDAELDQLLAGDGDADGGARAARTRSRRRRAIRSAGRAISGCSGRIGCSAATPRCRPTSTG